MRPFPTAAILVATTLPLHAQNALHGRDDEHAGHVHDERDEGEDAHAHTNPHDDHVDHEHGHGHGHEHGHESTDDRFASLFDPAFSFVVDGVADYRDHDSGGDGFDLDLRIVELAARSTLGADASAWLIVASDGDEVVLEEAAVDFTGLARDTRLRAGRFFVDFGREMQTHVHELSTLERPLVLRTYLGDEAAGDGIRLDHRFAVGDRTVVRASIAAFADLAGGHEHDEHEMEEPEVEVDVATRKHLDEFPLTARIVASRDLGLNRTLQLGASVQSLPEFAFELESSGAEVDGLASTLLGLDAMYGWTDDEGLRRWTLGGECVFASGDTGAAVDDAGTPDDAGDDALLVVDDSVGGYHVFAEYGWNARDGAGLSYGAVELADGARTDVTEIEGHWTRRIDDVHRLRLSVSSLDSDLAGEDSFRVALQYTAFLGAHTHSTDW